MSSYNPFSRRTEVSRTDLLVYRILTAAAWLLNVIPTVYYTYHAPHDDLSYRDHGHTIFGQSRLHPTPFTISYVFVDIYWIVMWILQVGYVWHLFSGQEAWVRCAVNVGPHFILWNVLSFVQTMFWVRGEFILAEVTLAINFLQLASLYFRHSIPTQPHLTTYTSSSTIKFIHIPAVSMPLVWSFFDLFWVGAVAAKCHNALVCRILANVAIWGIPAFAGTFLVAYGDWTVGFETSFLAAGLGVGQFFLKTWALQWIFAFAIMAIVFLATLAILYPRRSEDRLPGERAPLLREDA